MLLGGVALLLLIVVVDLIWLGGVVIICGDIVVLVFFCEEILSSVILSRGRSTSRGRFVMFFFIKRDDVRYVGGRYHRYQQPTERGLGIDDGAVAPPILV